MLQLRRILSGVLLVAVLLAAAPITTFANERSLSEQLADLTVILNDIGTKVAATKMSDADRLALMTQLVTISTQIMELKKGEYLTSGFVYSPTPAPATDATKKTAKSAGLTSVRAALDVKSSSIKAEYRYGSKIEKQTLLFTDLAAYGNFYDKVGKARELLAKSLSDGTGIKEGDIRDLTFVTARNPLWDKLVTQNSAQAMELFDNFGQNSIVNSVVVMPGNGKASITITTDQKEVLVLNLGVVTDEEGYITSPKKYLYSYTLHSTDPASYVYFWAEEGAKPVVAQSSSPIPEKEIKSFTTSLFNEVPFASKISDFEGKLVKFLTANPTYYEYGSVSSTGIKDCYYASDKVVVDEFIEYLVNGVASQYEELPKILKYSTPTVSSDSGYMGGCTAKKRFF